MTEPYLKELLRSLQTYQVQKKIWKSCLLFEMDLDMKNRYEKLSLQLHIIESCLSVLKEKDKYVIENHLINQKTWEETYILFEERWGTLNGRSIRTLKRMQKKALQEMLDFLHSSKMEIYLKQKLA